MEIKNILLDYWFSAREADVYITCLELWTAPVSSVARLLKLHRVTIYSVLKNLVEKSFITEVIKQNATYYTALWPEKLLKMLEDKYTNFKNSLPEFLAISSKFGNKPKVKFFEWIEWVKQMYNDLLDYPGEEICSFLGTWNIDKKLSSYLNLRFLPKRVKLKMHAKVILNNDAVNKQNYAALKKTSKKSLTEYKVYNYPFFNISNEIDLYWEDKVAMVLFSSEEMSGIVIQSKPLHDSLKSVFDLVRSCCPENEKPTPTRKQR